MRKKVLIIFCLLVVCALFIVVGGAISGDSLTIRQEEENEKIYIGVFEPLTGYNGIGGGQELLGLEYARTTRPTVQVGEVEYDIEFVVVDNESEAQAAKRAAAGLVSSRVSAVLGSYGCAVSEVGAGEFTAAGIPVIGISCTSPAPLENNTLYHSVCFSDSFQGSVLANFAYGKGWRSAAVVTQAGDIYSKGLGKYFTDEFTKLGGETQDFTFNSAQQNFNDLIKDLSSAKIDFVFMPSSPSSALIFISQAREANFTKPILGGDNWDTGVLISELGILGRQVYFSSPFSGIDGGNPESVAFAKKFSSWVSASETRLEQNGGGSYAPPVAALAYDAYMMLCDAIEGAGSYKSSDIAAYLGTASHSGITGKIHFEKGITKDWSAYIKSISVSDKTFEVVQTYLATK